MQKVNPLIPFIIVLFAIYGFYKLLEQLFNSSNQPYQLAPVVNVTVNLPENQSKELKAGDHVKGLAKIAWNKACEKVVAPI